MGELAKDFIEKFHNLTGDCVKERHKNLFLLFHKNHSLLTDNEDELDFVATNLEPANYLEKIFRIDFLIYFRRIEELRQEYLNGDNTVLRKMAKQDWFFQEAFKNVTSEEFVNDIFPTMPYVVKLKILKRLPVDEETGDEIFEALRERYGLFFATIFLPKCSANKIREILTNSLIELTSSQLQLLYDKDQNLIELYFDEKIKHEGNAISTNNNPIFKHIIQSNHEIFAKLFEKHKFSFKLGYKTSQKFIDSHKSNVLDKLESYLRILDRKAVVKKLGHELQDVFFKIDPTNRYIKFWEQSLKYYPKKQQFNLFKSYYDSTFCYKFGENVDAINHEMLEIITDPLEKEKLAKIKYEKDDDKDYLKHVSPDYCLSEFKKKVSQITAYEIADFLKILTICCIQNEDLKCLLEVCEMVAEQYKKYDYVCDEFFHAFRENLDILDKLSEEHWKVMLKIVAWSHAKETWGWSCTDRLIRIKYLEYLINNDKPFREFISQYSYWPHWINCSLDRNNIKINKKVICELIEIEHTEKQDESQCTLDDLLLVIICKKFNDQNPEDAVDILNHSRILQSLKNILENELYCNEDSNQYQVDSNSQNNAIKYMICRTGSFEELDELKMLYFKKIQKYGQMSACLWFLKHEPKTFHKYLHYFLEGFDKISEEKYLKKIWYFMKAYSHLGLDKEVVEFCKLKLKEDGVLKKELIEALTILAPADSHLEFMKSYVPTSDKIDTRDNDDQIKNQCNLIKFLHLVQSPKTVLPMALQFCKGDYIKFALCPLYSCMYKLPENEVKSVIEKLSQDEAYSVKKHAVHLSCVILDKKTTYNYLNDPLISDLLPISKYFIKNPSESIWELIETKLSDPNINHLRIFKWVIGKPFPSTLYKMKYIEASWAILNQNVDMKKLMFEKMDLRTIQKLHPDFGYKIIEENIFKTGEANELIANLLIHMNDANKYEFMKKMFNNLKENYWTQRKNARSNFHEFIQSLSKIYFKTETVDEDFADRFCSVFNSVFLLSEAFEEHVMVTLWKVKGKAAENCAEICVEFNNTLIVSYGRAVVDLFGNVIKEQFLPLLFENEDDVMKFCYFIWKMKKSTDDYLLVIKLLPYYHYEYYLFRELYNDMLLDLEQVTDDFIRLKFNLYLTSLVIVN